MAFYYAINRILNDWEKYYSNNPLDKGKETIWGIASATHPEHIAKMKQMSVEDAKQYAIAVYKKEYWDKAFCNEWPNPVNIYVLDMAIQHGIKRTSDKDRGAIDLLQEAAGTLADGKVGPNTRRAVSSWNPIELLDECHAIRTLYYTSLSDWGVHGKGWMRRISEIFRICIQYNDAAKILK